MPKQEELGSLEGRGFQEESYAYVACMAVRKQDRRKGVASALLKAAEIQVHGEHFWRLLQCAFQQSQLQMQETSQ